MPKADGSGPDGTCKFVKSTSKPLEKYIRSTYPDLWKKKDALINPHKHGDTSNVEDLDVPAENYRPMCKTNVDECNQELVRWFMKHDRPKHMVCDEGLAAFIQKVQLLPGLYELPNEEELGICYKRRGVLGVTKAEQWVYNGSSNARHKGTSHPLRGTSGVKGIFPFWLLLAMPFLMMGMAGKWKRWC